MLTSVFVQHTIFHKSELNQKENIHLSNNSTTVFYFIFKYKHVTVICMFFDHFPYVTMFVHVPVIFVF